MENFENMDWEALSPPVDSEAEMKKIRKNIRKRNWKIVLTSVILVIALLVGTIQFAIPALEKQYWDPNKKTYSEINTDLEYALAAYGELTCPQQGIISVFTNKTGFAQYALDIQTYSSANATSPDFRTATLNKNMLTLPRGFWDSENSHFFMLNSLFRTDDENIRKVLSTLPGYIHLRAAVTFPEDRNMHEVLRFDANQMYDGGTLEWVAIRTSDTVSYPFFGMKLFDRGSHAMDSAINNSYPCFSMTDLPNIIDRETLENHFRSLMQYTLDQHNAGYGVGAEYLTAEDYQNALDYVEENGIYSNGGFISGSPKMFIRLLDSGLIEGISIVDAWLEIE